MPHYKDAQNKIHWLDDDSSSHMLPEGSIQITDAEAESLRVASIPVPTAQQNIVAIEQANPITHRNLRDLTLAVATIAQAALGVNPADNPAVRKIMELDAAIAALRAQL